MKNIKISSLLLLLALSVALLASCVGFGGHTHSLTKVDKVNPTCTEAGTEAYYVCDGCDKIFADINGKREIEAPKAIDALGHKLMGIAGNEATCTEEGKADCYKCHTCNTLFSDPMAENVITAPETTPALGHTLVKVDAKEVSCFEDGCLEYYVCSTCKKIYSDAEGTLETTLQNLVIKSEGHNLIETEAHDATCTTPGNKAYFTCDKCGNVYADKEASSLAGDVVIPATGHKYGTLVVEGAKTVYEPGENFDLSTLVVKLDCENCDHVEVVSDYSVSQIENLQPSDSEIVITYGNYSAVVNVTVKHTHTTGELVAAVAPDCTNGGSREYYECTVCGAKFVDKEATQSLDSIEIAPKGHTGVKTEAVAPTCTSTGNCEYWTCADCGLIFADQECTQQINLADTVLPSTDHSYALTYDKDYHWNYCVDCGYTPEKQSHSGFGYPGEIPTCDSCGAEMGDAGDFDGWVEFRPGINEVTSGVVTSATHVDLNGILASKYVFGAANAGAESVIWTMSDRHDYKEGKYQVRVPTVSNDRYIYLYVSNDGDTAVNFRLYSENYGDKGGVDINLGAGESGWFKYTINTGRTVGSNMNIKLLSDLASETAVTIYGYFYLPENEITDLHIINQNEIKLSYELGDVFTLPELLLGAYVADSNGNVLSDGGDELYYIASNYTVSGLENGQILNELGSFDVTVSFGGKSVTLTVTVSSHEHEIVCKPYIEATCDHDGYALHYVCTVDGCGQIFADAEGNNPISHDDIVIAKGHLAVQLPGTAEYCTRCGEILGDQVMSGEHWVLFRPEIAVGSGSFPGWKAEYTDVDGVYGSMFTFGAGVNAGDRISLTMWNEQGNFQTIIPNGLDAAVANRTVIMYYHNYGTEPITIKFQNDSNSSIYDEVTIPAGGVVVSTFDHPKSGGGSNWFYLQVQNDIQTDVTVGVYGFFYLENEFNSVSIVKNANKLSFVEGEMFSAEGLMLKTSGGIKTTFVETGFTTNFDGVVFNKAGNYTVEVSFGGKTVSYDIEVTAHKHNTELVAGKSPIKCVSDGVQDYYKCTVEGCDEKFADKDASVKISAPVVISCHTATPTLPGREILCADCNTAYAVRDISNWVFYNITTDYNNNGVVNGRIEAADIDGVSGTMIYIGAGTAGGTGNNFQLCMGNNEAGKQTIIPNLGSNAADGELRHVIVFYKNYSNEAVTLNLQNDAHGGNGSVTIPANGTAICEFDIHNVGGSNWFNLYIDSNVTTDVQIGAYGFIYVNDSEVNEINLNTEKCNLTFNVGDSFSANGLVVNAPIPSSNTKTIYATTGYTTSLDGVVFDKAGTYTVEVSFAGKTASYEITVK